MARNDLPYFPVVPENAPSDDLRSYLNLFSQEAVAMRSPTGPSHAEWDVNTRIPVMRTLRGVAVTPLRTLEGLFGVGDPMGVDPATRYNVAAGTATVPSLWAQRAVNAMFAQLGLPTRIVTDGAAGPQTLAALKTLRLRMLADLQRFGPLPTTARVIAMPSIVDRAHVSISGFMHDSLMAATQVADVAAPAAPVAHEPVWTTETWEIPARGPAPGGVVLAVALGLAAAMWFGRRR